MTRIILVRLLSYLFYVLHLYSSERDREYLKYQITGKMELENENFKV